MKRKNVTAEEAAMWQKARNSGMTAVEVADAAGCTESTVRNHTKTPKVYKEELVEQQFSIVKSERDTKVTDKEVFSWQEARDAHMSRNAIAKVANRSRWSINQHTTTPKIPAEYNAPKLKLRRDLQHQLTTIKKERTVVRSNDIRRRRRNRLELDSILSDNEEYDTF